MKSDITLTVTEPTELLPFLLAKQSGKGRNKVKAMLTHRQVLVDDHVVTKHNHPLKAGQRVVIRAASTAMKESTLHGIKILFEDEHIIVIDKPPGLLSIATEEEREKTAYFMLTDYVRQDNPKARIFIVHRLDKDTSGVMMVAKSEDVQQALQNNWKEVVLERSYVVVVQGRVTDSEGTIDTWLKESQTQKMYVSRPGDGFHSVTHYRVLNSNKDYSLLEVRLETGRKNQIRAHMQHIGHSIVGDKRYGFGGKNFLGRLGLHARVLSFRHPVTEEVLRFETAIPFGFRRLFSEKKSGGKGVRPKDDQNAKSDSKIRN